MNPFHSRSCASKTEERVASRLIGRSIDRSIARKIPLRAPGEARADDQTDAPLLSQAQRVAAEYKRLDDELMEALSLEEAQTVVANGSRVGTACLNTFPVDARTTLSDHQMQVLLHNRTLLRADTILCADCLHPNDHGHDDDCLERPHRRTVRHDTIKHLLVAALRRVKGTQARAEPRLQQKDKKRTDWRVHGTAAAGGGGTTDYDITFVSTTNQTARQAAGRAQHLQLISQKGMRAAAHTRLHAYLDSKAEYKTHHYQGATPSALVPLVFSLDGAEHPQVTTTFKHWRSLMPSFSYVVSTISIAIARTRAETFRLVHC